MPDNLKGMGHLPLTALIAALINNKDGIGSIKLMEVEATTENYFEDKGIDLTQEDILRLLVDIDDQGDFAIRYGVHTDTGSTKLGSSELGMEQLQRKIIGKTADGKAYLRLVFQTEG